MWQGKYMLFLTDVFAGATWNGKSKANVTTVMANTWLTTDHKVTQTEGAHTDGKTEKRVGIT